MHLGGNESLSHFQLICAAALLWSLAFGVTAESTKVSFVGQEIEWIVPFKEGGGTDASARFFAPFLSKHLAGNPKLTIRNVPGGASTKAANIFATEDRSDGLTILGTSASTQFAYLLGDPRVRYNYAEWSTLMISQSGGVVYISPDLGIREANQLGSIADKRLYYGSQGTTSIDLVPLLAFDFLGLNVRPIFGISGRAIGRFAFERGDATIDFQTSPAYLQSVQPMVDEGRAIPLFSLGVLSPQGDMVRDPNFPDLPHFAEVFEMITGAPPTGIAWQSWLTLYAAGFAMNDILVAPKHTDQDILNAYHEAITAMQEDPVYLRERNRATGNYNVVTGKTAQSLYKLGTEIDSRHKNWLSAWLKENYNVNLKD